MSDSDEELTENNVFPNENTFLRGQGPFMNNKFKRIASSTYSNPISSHNLMNSYGFNHRSIYHRRDTSPMSMQSVPDFSRHNFDGSYYGRGTSCQRSVINGRSQSPASVGSMDSTTSAAYVAQIFKNMKFNKYDKRIINEAYNKYFRNRARRRIGKRRKLKLFLNHNRRKSGDDSGDDGSNSSISSDDNRSVRSAVPRESILRPSNRANRTEILHFRATMKESDMYKDCTENLKHSTLQNMFNGHNSVMHTIPEKTNNTVMGIQREKYCNTINNVEQQKATGFVGMQKDRFTKGFVLPSQRFNKSIVKPIANMPLSTEVCLLPDRNNANNTDSENEEIFSNKIMRENIECRKRALDCNDIICPNEKKNKLSPSTSNILRDDMTFKKPQMPLRRPIKAKPNFLSESINSKLSQSITKNNGQASCLSQSLDQNKSLLQPYRKFNGFLNIRNTVHTVADNSKRVNTESDNDEIFPTNTTKSNNSNSNSTQQKVIESISTDDRNNNDKKIASPAKKKTNKAPKIKNKNSKKDCQELPKQMQNKDNLTEESNAEVLISKSLQPLVGNVEIITTIPNNKSQTNPNTENGNDVNISENPLSRSEVSMKPSFIKRKLFTQNRDIAEEKHMSDNSINSPQTRNYKSREKNKVRKLATSQSCLSRNVIGEENILDLIHKIVPADQINMTAASHQRTRKCNPENEVKWDVASVISMCNNTNESDTFTDEEIFQVNKANNKNKKQVNIKTTQVTEQQNCKVVLEKIPDIDFKKIDGVTDVKNTNWATKRTVASRVRSFWDTDFETDVEDNIRTPLKPPANRLGQIKEIETVAHCKNVPQPKDTTVNSIRSRINSSMKKLPSRAPEEKSSNHCQTIENTSNKLIDDKNIQDHHRTPPSKRAPKNIPTKYDLKAFLESKELTSDNNLSKKGTNNVKTINGLKSAEKKTVTNKTTKNDRKPLGKNDVTKPTRKNNTKLIEKDNKTEAKTQKATVVKSILSDTLNSSIDEHSILTRNLRLRNKQQLLNDLSLNSTDNYSKSTPKPISKAKTINTPKRIAPKKVVGSNKKQTTINATKRYTPPRRAKEKKSELTKLNESSMSTRNRSTLNTRLRV